MAQEKKNNSIKDMMLILSFIAMFLESFAMYGQLSRDFIDRNIYKKVQSLEDSLRRSKPRKQPIYIGVDLSLSFQQYALASKIAQLAGLGVSYIGTNVGGSIGNPMGKLKTTIGMYYSEPAVPYTIDMFQGSITGSIYILRLKKIIYHTFEPYVSLGLTHQHTQFYGDYLSNEGGNSTITNYSTSEQTLAGKVGFTQMNLGTGFEYQLENYRNQFIHLFAEIDYGTFISSNTSSESFSGTKLMQATTISVGVNFGIVK